MGDLCFPLLREIMRAKLDPKSIRCILSYDKDHKGYKCLRYDNKEMFISRNIRFHEKSFPSFSTSSNQERCLLLYFSHLLLNMIEPSRIVYGHKRKFIEKFREAHITSQYTHMTILIWIYRFDYFLHIIYQLINQVKIEKIFFQSSSKQIFSDQLV